MTGPEDRSWRGTRHSDRPSEPTETMVEAGVKALKKHGGAALLDMVPRRWLEKMARETWKAMAKASAGDGH